MGSLDDHACRLLYCGPLYKKIYFTLQYDFVRLTKLKSVVSSLVQQYKKFLQLLHDQASSSRQAFFLVGASKHTMLCIFIPGFPSFPALLPLMANIIRLISHGNNLKYRRRDLTRTWKPKHDPRHNIQCTAGGYWELVTFNLTLPLSRNYRPLYPATPPLFPANNNLSIFYI